MIRTVFLSGILVSAVTMLRAAFPLGLAPLHDAFPDLALLMVVWIAFTNRREEGVLVGFIAGLLTDFLSSSPPGTYAFSYTSIAWVASTLSGAFGMDAILVPAAFGFTVPILKATSFFLLHLVFGPSIFQPSPLEARFWIECALSMLVAPPLFHLMHRLRGYLVTPGEGGHR